MKKITFKETAYEYIRGCILSGKWLPGDIVEEKEIATVLGVSRTPVHEAIAQLAEEGLLSVMPRRGTFVAHISIADIKSVYQVRKLVEVQTTILATQSASHEKLLQYKKMFEGNAAENSENDLDGDFHRYLAECTQNKYFMKIVDELMVQSVRIRSLSNRRANHRMEQSAMEHIAIIDALLEGNGEKAGQEMLSHLSRSEDGYRNIFSETSYFSI